MTDQASIVGYGDHIGPLDPAVTGRALQPFSPDVDYVYSNKNAKNPGMRVILSAIPGVTQKGLMPHSFRFQMPPLETFTRTMSYTHTDFDTVAGKQHDRPSALALQTVKFQTLFMDWDATYAVWPHSKAQQENGGVSETARAQIWNVLNMTTVLQNVLQSGTPVRLRAGQPYLWAGGVQDGWDVNMMVTLRDLSIEERAGEIDARYVDVSFTQHRSFALARKKLRKGTSKLWAEKVQGVSRHTPTTFTVYLGDGHSQDAHGWRPRKPCLASLAHHYYGDYATVYPLLAANNVLLANNATPNMDLRDIARALKNTTGGRLKLRVPKLDTGDDQSSEVMQEHLATIPEDSL